MATTSPRKKVISIGWNLASWEIIHPLLDQGKLPHLRSLIEHGLMASLRTQRPLIENIVFNSLATGATADQHGVLGDHEVGVDDTIRDTDSLSRRVDAVWDTASDAGFRCNVVNFPFTGPAEKISGIFVAPSFFNVVPGSIGETIEVPRVSVYPESELEQLSEFIVTLQDIDAEVMSSFVPRFRELDAADPRLVYLGNILASTFSTHAIATHCLEDPEWNLVCVSYDLIQYLAGYFFPFHSIPGQDTGDTFQRHRIAMHLFPDVINSAVTLCDLLLGRLLELAGEDAAVLLYSPYGAQSSKNQEQLSEMSDSMLSEPFHRGEGIFLFRDPSLPSDELLHEIGCLDIVPTILRTLDLPKQNWMSGRAVHDVEQLASFQKGNSHSVVPQDAPPSRLKLLSEWDRPLNIRFNEPFSEKNLKAIEENNLWALAIVLLSSSGLNEAISLLLRLYHANPLQVTRGYLVAESLYRFGFLRDALVLMKSLGIIFARQPVGKFMLGMVALHNQQTEDAKELFEDAYNDGPPFPILYFYLGQAYLLLNTPEKAEQAFSRFIELDPCLPQAYLGHSESLLQLKRFEDAAEVAFLAVGADFMEPAMHLALGRAVAQLGDKARAQEAYETALKIAPENKLASDHLEWLAQYYDETIRDPTKDTWRSLTPPLYPQVSKSSQGNRQLKEVIEEIEATRSDYLDRFESMEKNLMAAYEAILKTQTDSEVDLQENKSLQVITKELWGDRFIVRPMEPKDQVGVNALSFENPFAKPSETEIFVMHAVGDQTIYGAAMLQWEKEDPRNLTMRLSTPSDSDSENSNLEGTESERRAKANKVLATRQRLILGGLARGHAGDAADITLKLELNESTKEFINSLKSIGFAVVKSSDIFAMNLAKMRAVGGAMTQKYRDRNLIPADVRLTSVDQLPFEQVDAFFRRWFEDGAGNKPDATSQAINPVLVHGDKIIACCIGSVINEELSRAKRLAVLPEYQRSWATAWLIEAGATMVGNYGCEILEFYNDEEAFPHFSRLAKSHLNAIHRGVSYTLKFDFSKSTLLEIQT